MITVGKKKFQFNEGNCIKSCFTGMEFEALLIMVFHGYAPDRLEPSMQKEIDKKLETAAMRVLGTKDWKEHVKDLTHCHGSKKNIEL
jgi:hypothetical protein